MSIATCPNGHQYLAKKHSVCPYCGAAGSRDEGEKTQIVWDQSEYAEEPLKAWIVVIEGADRGTDFPLQKAITSIGRGERSAIKLNDQTISRKGNVLSIAYDRIGNKFYTVKGDADTNVLAYLNGEPVTGSVELKAYDRIRISESVLLFIPFCGTAFNWEDNEKEEEQ